MTSLTLKGRCAVVTGAASGIGRALAIEAIKRGMTVAACDVDAEGLDRLSDEAASRGGRLLARTLDLRSAEATAAFAEEVAEWAPSIALVFSNAGIMPRTDSIRPDLKAWDMTIDVNLRGTVHVLSAFLGRMIDHGEPAQFVITASQAAFTTAPMISPYVATKHALWGLAECLRHDLKAAGAPVGISVLAPGRVRSGITLESQRQIREKDGDEAAARYDSVLLDPETVARWTIDRVATGEFLLAPSRESIASSVETRFAEAVGAIRNGLID